MMRRALLALGSILSALCVAPIAAALPAQDVTLITDDVAEFGVFVEEGVEDAYGVPIDIDEIDAAVAAVRATGQDGGLVILSADASDHASLAAFSNATLQELGRRGAAVDTVVAVTPDQIWAVSSSAGAIDTALDASSSAFSRGDFADGYEAFFAALDPADATAAAPSDAGDPDEAAGEQSAEDSGGGIGWFLPALLIAGLCLAGFLFWRSRRARQQQMEVDMDTARAELREETTAASDLIWELSEQITEAPRDVEDLFEEASDTFQEVGERARTVTTPAEMQELIRRLGRATWQLEVVEARIEGRPPPPEPTPKQIEVPVRENPPPPPQGSHAVSTARSPPGAPPAGSAEGKGWTGWSGVGGRLLLGHAAAKGHRQSGESWILATLQPFVAELVEPLVVGPGRHASTRRIRAASRKLM